MSIAFPAKTGSYSVAKVDSIQAGSTLTSPDCKRIPAIACFLPNGSHSLSMRRRAAFSDSRRLQAASEVTLSGSLLSMLLSLAATQARRASQNSVSKPVSSFNRTVASTNLRYYICKHIRILCICRKKRCTYTCVYMYAYTQQKTVCGLRQCPENGPHHFYLQPEGGQHQVPCCRTTT